MELQFARQCIVTAARAAGIDALDTVFSNLNDMDTFRREVEMIKAMGFDGKSIINPRQIEVVNEIFAPKEKEIEKAKTIIAAIKEAEKRGSGVIAVNGKWLTVPWLSEHNVPSTWPSAALSQRDHVLPRGRSARRCIRSRRN